MVLHDPSTGTKAMPDTSPTETNAPIVATYRQRTPASAALHARASHVLPGGLAHDTRYMKPWPIYVDRAQGARKWDADGNEYVDYMGGHGALLLGHGHPAVTAAAHAQLDRGTHYGSCHALEAEWAELICAMVPSAEKVRFTASGTEATLLAVRLARALTGRTKVVHFSTHFHGWHDHFAAGYMDHFDGSAPRGVLPEVAADVLPARTDRPDAVRALLEGRDDIAAVFLEPTGASWGRVPVDPGFVAMLRAITADRGVLLVFDEVISGFRVAPDCAQGRLGITPDLTTLAKVAAGGLPGGLVAGRADLFDLLDFDAMAEAGAEKVLHFGTFNANPLTVAAGIAALEVIRDTDACARASAYGARLRAAMTDVLADEGVAWAMYGEHSGFHLFTNPERRPCDPRAFDPLAVDIFELKNNAPAATKLRLGMLNHGVDINGWPGGLISAVHDDDDLDRTLSAFRATIRDLKNEGDLADWT
jgi:glutamate-1-semialdehyde 2,1-aminomutase